MKKKYVYRVLFWGTVGPVGARWVQISGFSGGKKSIFFDFLGGLYYRLAGLYYMLAGLYYMFAGLYYVFSGLYYMFAGLLRG